MNFTWSFYRFFLQRWQQDGDCIFEAARLLAGYARIYYMNGIWFSNSTRVQSGFHVRFQGWMEAEGTCFNQSNTENISGIERNAVGMYVWYLRYINRKHQYTQQGSANLWTLFEDPKTFWQTTCLVNKWQEQERTGKNQPVDLNRLPSQNPEKWPWQPLSAWKVTLSRPFHVKRIFLLGNNSPCLVTVAPLGGPKSLRNTGLFLEGAKKLISTPFLVLGLWCCKCRRFIGVFFGRCFFYFGGCFRSQRSTPSHRPRVDHLRGSPWTLPSRGNAENQGSNDVYRAVEGEEVWRVLEEALQCLGISIAKQLSVYPLYPDQRNSSKSDHLHHFHAWPTNKVATQKQKRMFESSPHPSQPEMHTSFLRWKAHKWV